MQVTEPRTDTLERPFNADGDTVATWGVLRIASVPARVLGTLRPVGTLALVEQLLAGEKDLQSLQVALEDALYALVPMLEHDDALRSAALELRRDIHNLRPPKLCAQQLETLASSLHPVAARALRHWLDVQRSHHTTREKAEKLLEQERGEMRVALRECLSDDSFRRALALASAEVFRESQRERSLPRGFLPSKYERTLLSYIIRACAKTSPFSMFMMQCPFEWTPHEVTAPAEIASLERETVARLNRGIVARVLRAALGATRQEDRILIRLNKSARRTGEDRVQALCDRPTVLLGRPWREQRRAAFRFNRALLDPVLASEREGTWTDWMRRLAAHGIPPDKSNRLVEGLLERDVLEYAALTDGYDQAPDASVLAYMHESEKAEVRQASVALGRMMELASGFSHQDAGARVQQMVELSRLEGEALRTLGSPPKEPLQNVIVEDSYGTRMSVAASLNLSTHIREMERCLSERICMSSEYIRLRNAFVDRFGEGGVCIDISSFLSDTTDHVIEIFGMANRAEGMDAVRAEPGSRLGVTAHIQISAPDAQGAQGGSSSEPLVVVNRVYEGIGWLSARFACGHLPENAMVRRRLEEWIQHVYSPREPVDFLINADCNDLQAHPRLTKRTFAWPGEPLRLPAGEVVDAAQLVIRHDPLTGLLDLFDQDRRPIALVYLGSVLPTFAWGVPYVVWVLSHPFKIRRPAMSPSLEASAEDVIRQPRLTQGNVVLRRATWWIRSSYLKEHWFSKGGLSQLMGVARHAEKWQIPHTFFSQRMLLPPKSAVVPASVLDSSPKPIWVDRRSPFSLCLMEQMTAQSEWLVVTEALPNPEESVVRLAGQRHVSEIQIEMLIRAA